MKIRRLIVLCTAASLLFGCSTSNSSSTAEPETTSQTSSDINGVKVTTTAEPTEAPTEPEPEIILNDSVVAFSAASGFYDEEFPLEITSDTKDVIYYTTDGSDPRTSSTRQEYSGAINIKDRSGDKNVVSAVEPEVFCGSFCEYRASQQKFISTVGTPSDSDVDKCTIIRAASEAEDGTFSKVATSSYFIGSEEDHIDGISESCAASGKSLAVISISMEYDDLFSSSNGIYVKGDIFEKALDDYIAGGEYIEAETARQLDANYKQKGMDWERECHIDFFECSPDETVSVISQDCGIRIQGNYSRSDLQKGFRLFARTEYGDKRFRYPVFGEDAVRQNGEVIDTFKSIVLRAGGNCAFSSKFNDTYWQALTKNYNYATKASRPCVVYLNGEYWGLYVLEEDFSNEYFEDHYDVPKENVVVYKGDAESLSLGYKLDEGKLPEGVTDESYYFNELFDFFHSHENLENQEDYDEFSKLVDTESVRDYFLTEIWINNKWDWPGKNWSMWKSTLTDGSTPYADGKWRFMLYDVEFGGIMGENDVYVNTIKEDNYKELGLLDMNTGNPAVLCFAYLMTNETFRNDFNTRLLEETNTTFEYSHASELLDQFEAEYSPLYDQFFRRYPGSGSTEDAVDGGYASIKCIRDFLEKRPENIPPMIEWTEKQYD